MRKGERANGGVVSGVLAELAVVAFAFALGAAGVLHSRVPVR